MTIQSLICIVNPKILAKFTNQVFQDSNCFDEEPFLPQLISSFPQDEQQLPAKRK
jgi:hypothetical protein